MDIQVYRTNASAYQNHNFFQQEKNTLEKIPGVKYISSLTEIDESKPFILLTNTHTKPSELPRIILEKTMLMIHPNSGYDNFHVSFVEDASFPIIIGNPIRSHAVVEYILSCIFHHFTRIPHHQHWSSDRKWERKLLRDQKVLIMGHGHIGKTLYRSLQPLSREVLIHDPYEEFDLVNVNQIKEWDDALLDGVQVLIIASSLNMDNIKFFDQARLKRLDSECLIINPSRGELIDEKELITFLKKNPSIHCYLDVFEKEPFKPGHMHDLKNVNKTSHIAGVYSDLNKDIINFEYHIIRDFLSRYMNEQRSQFENDYQHCILKNKIVDNQMI
jgi:D-3-phosphoglycerate dehydrogenase